MLDGLRITAPHALAEGVHPSHGIVYGRPSDDELTSSGPLLSDRLASVFDRQFVASTAYGDTMLAISGDGVIDAIDTTDGKGRDKRVRERVDFDRHVKFLIVPC